MAIATKQELQNYLELFESFEKRTSGPEYVRKLRQDAFARFWELGFPTLKDEDWRFTSLSPITSEKFQLARPAEVTLAQVESVAAPFANRIVFVNGRFAPGLSSTGALPKGVTVASLTDSLTNPLLQRHLAEHEDFRNEAFTALNTAFVEDGAFVHVKRGVVAEQPIYVLYVSTGDSAQLINPRNLIVADEQSQAVVVEDYVSLRTAGQESGATLSNVVTELVAADDAVISHYMIEREDEQSFNISTLSIRHGRNANVDSHSILTGGALVRNNVHPVLAGDGADCLINGLFVGNGRQHLDNYMKVEHASPHCNSRQFYNGILDGHSRGVFHGRIIVHKDAQKTDAKQTNRNLLLSDDAQIDTKPQLEIYADDVKCTHGATIGQIDEEALFYMRSRGIPDAESRRLLLFAFAGECLERMKPGPVLEWLKHALPAWLPMGTSPR